MVQNSLGSSLSAASSALFAAGLLAATALTSPAEAVNYSYSPQLNQIGATPTVQGYGFNGQGVLLGIVDTGVLASNPEVAGRVVSSSSCAAVTFACAHGYTDDNSHGTAVAAIAAGSTSAPTVGVAPSASILAEKVLNASGSGYDVDVANGIIKAANGGAGVINLSLTYIPSAAVISAINYATSRGAYVVFAGGNSAAALNSGANTYGLTATAVQHLVFVGSVNSANSLSSFSNTPGKASVVDTSGKATAYSAIWLMAPGENIIAPYVTYLNGSYYAYWTGTSMSAPLVSGSLALLLGRWPFLATTGTAAQILEATAQSLGSASLYGDGLVRDDKAFQPVGTLTTVVGNKSVALSQVSGTLVSSSSMGTLKSLGAALSNLSAYDSYKRDFSINLSGLITAAASQPSKTAAASPSVTSATTHFGEAGFASFAKAEDFGQVAVNSGLMQGKTSHSGLQQGGGGDLAGWSSAFSNGTTTWVAGAGFSPSASLATTLYGENSALSLSDAAVSNALLGLTEGGSFGGLSTRTSIGRLAIGYASADSGRYDGLTGTTSKSDGVALAYGLTPVEGLDLGVSLSELSESNALLGSSWTAGGPLALSSSRSRSTSIGLSAEAQVADGLRWGVDGMMAHTPAAAVSNSLITGTSAITSFAFGTALKLDDAFQEGDVASLSVKMPLRVYEGSAHLALPEGTDMQGNPVIQTSSAKLAPTGVETDIGLGYRAKLAGAEFIEWHSSAVLRLDADNEAGKIDPGFKIGLSMAF